MRRLLALALLLQFALPTARADDWPQWLGPQRDGIWRETGLLDSFLKGGLKERWRVPVGMGYSGPAVAGGKVFLMDRILAEGAKNPANPFAKDKLPGKERVLCLDEATGNILWTHAYDCPYEVSYPAGPRCTPTVGGDKVYTLGTMGDLFCLDIRSGKVIWSKNFPRDYEARVQIWGFAGHPLLDGNKLICLVGGEGSAVVAFDKDTGKELWKSVTTATGAGYCPPMIYELGGKRQLILWTPDAVRGLDPETGKLNWKERFIVKADMTIPTPIVDGDKLLVTCFYNGSMLLQVTADGVKVLWKGKGRGELPDQTDGLHSVMSTPFIKDGYIYGVCSHGELRCLKEATGERVWSTLEATTNDGKPVRWANAFLVQNGDRCFLFNEQGDLILARLTPEGYHEISRTHLLDSTNTMASMGLGRPKPVVWSHPACADRCVFARNDKEFICVSLAANGK